MPRSLLISFVCLLFLLDGSSIAFAGLVDEHSWSEASPDGQYLLVMLLPMETLKQRQEIFAQDNVVFEDGGSELRDKFSKSGVYKNDGSTVPLWTLPYHIQVYDVYFSENGEHLLLAQEDTHHTVSNIPVGGYLYFNHKNGSQQSWPEHKIGWGWGLKHLLTYRLLGIRGNYWTAWISTQFEPAHNTYSINTEKGEAFTFDLTTGQIIHSSSVWNQCLLAFFVATPVLVYFLLRKKGEQSAYGTTFRHYSIRDLLLLITAFSIWLWLATISWLLAITIIVAPAIGGCIAWIWSRKARTWITGALLATYGCVWGLFLWSILIEPLMWASEQESPYIWFLPTFAVIGLIGGSILAGILDRRISVVPDSLLPSATSC